MCVWVHVCLSAWVCADVCMCPACSGGDWIWEQSDRRTRAGCWIPSVCEDMNLRTNCLLHWDREGLQMCIRTHYDLCNSWIFHLYTCLGLSIRKIPKKLLMTGHFIGLSGGKNVILIKETLARKNSDKCECMPQNPTPSLPSRESQTAYSLCGRTACAEARTAGMALCASRRK